MTEISALPGNKEQEPVRIITRENYWMAMGLAQRHRKLHEELAMIEGTIAQHVGEPEDEPGSGYYGHVSDALWDGASIDEMLRRLRVEVAPIEEE